MRTAAIDRELAQELEQLAEAQAAASKAAEQLAREPNSPNARLAVVQAQAAVAEIQVGIDALKAARNEAEKYDASEEAQAIRAKRAETVGRVASTQEAVVTAARAIDDALQTLRTRMQDFAAAREAAKQAAFAYLDLNETDPDTRAHHIELILRTPGALAHAVMLNLHYALKDSGLLFQDYITFNPYELTHTGGVGVVLEKSMGDQAARNAERVASTVREIEKLHQ